MKFLDFIGNYCLFAYMIQLKKIKRLFWGQNQENQVCQKKIQVYMVTTIILIMTRSVKSEKPGR